MGARERILQRLRRYPAERLTEDAPFASADVDRDQRERLQVFRERMKAVKGEVMTCDRDKIAQSVSDWLLQTGAKRLMAGMDARLDPVIEQLPDALGCLRMTLPYEEISELLFDSVDAGISHCDGAVSETGSLVIASCASQPRTLSLVPPLHVALLPKASIRSNLAELLEDWNEHSMPSNLLLISGPSKSADIEQVLAYGVHGPKRLLTVIFE